MNKLCGTILAAVALAATCRADVGADKAKLLVVGNSIVRHPVAPHPRLFAEWRHEILL